MNVEQHKVAANIQTKQTDFSSRSIVQLYLLSSLLSLHHFSAANSLKCGLFSASLGASSKLRLQDERLFFCCLWSCSLKLSTSSRSRLIFIIILLLQPSQY